MQMRKTTYYAIEIMLELGNQERKTIPEMEETLNIKASYLRKILRTLRDEGLVFATSGHGGGYMLNKEAKAITLWDIVCIMECDIDAQCCIVDKQDCNRNLEKCIVRRIYYDIQKDMKEGLSKYSIQDLLTQNTAKKICQFENNKH